MVASRYRERTLSVVVQRAAATLRAVVVTGPRQSGKTTLVRRLFGSTHCYCSLDEPTVRAQALASPSLVLARFPPPVILDEIQYAPELLHHVKLDIDEHGSTNGRYVITGSQAFPLMQGVTESLAGRAAVLSLLSLSLREAMGKPDPRRDGEDLLFPRRTTPPGAKAAALAEMLLRGGFPEPALRPSVDPKLWHASYVQTYLERDVRSLRAVGDLDDFQRLLVLLAVRAGSLVNLEDLSRDLGVTGKTVKAWISVLEASGQVFSCRPYYANLGKRLVKRPKIYFLDTGTLSYLLGLGSADQTLAGMAAGPIFETAVLGQLHRLFSHRGEAPRISFWRTAAGHEVDFVVEHGSTLIPIEAKLTANPSPRDAAAIEQFQGLLGPRAGKGLLVCLTRERYPLTHTVDAVPLGAF